MGNGRRSKRVDQCTEGGANGAADEPTMFPGVTGSNGTVIVQLPWNAIPVQNHVKKYWNDKKNIILSDDGAMQLYDKLLPKVAETRRGCDLDRARLALVDERIQWASRRSPTILTIEILWH